MSSIVPSSCLMLGGTGVQDVLVLMQAPVVPMSFLRAKPIGVMPMIDQGEQDDKIIAVHADDPEFRDYNDINELPKHRLAEIKRYCVMCTVVCACIATSVMLL